MRNIPSEAGTEEVGNVSVSNQRNSRIRKYDVNALRQLSSAFNNSISVNPDFIAALEQVIEMGKAEFSELWSLDALALKAYNLFFISKEERRKRAIDLIQSILTDYINPELDANDKYLVSAILGKMILPAQKWAMKT